MHTRSIKFKVKLIIFLMLVLRALGSTSENKKIACMWCWSYSASRKNFQRINFHLIITTNTLLVLCLNRTFHNWHHLDSKKVVNINYAKMVVARILWLFVFITTTICFHHVCTHTHSLTHIRVASQNFCVFVVVYVCIIFKFVCWHGTHMLVTWKNIMHAWHRHPFLLLPPLNIKIQQNTKISFRGPKIQKREKLLSTKFMYTNVCL